MKPTIRSIAQELNLSPATVSKALSGRPEISEATRTLVVSTAKQRGYFKLQPSKQRIAVLLTNPDGESDAHSSFLYNLLVGFRKYAGRLQQEVLIITVSPEDQQRQTLGEFARDAQLEGMFILGLKTTDPFCQQISSTETPVVVLDIDVSGACAGSVGTNSILGARLAIDHLASLGHRRIGFVNGHDEAYVSHERMAGYMSALHTGKIPFDPKLVFPGDYSMESGARAAEHFEKTDATAIFFASDIMAFGAMRRLMELGISLPRDISLVGFDNLPITQGCIPSLTTVAQDIVGLGETACATLSCLINGVPIHKVTLEPTLLVRESTAPPPVRKG